MSESFNGSPYWQEIRNGLFVHNEVWNKTIDRLPNLISYVSLKQKLQTVDQLLGSGLKGIGAIGFKSIEVSPKADVLIDHALWFEDLTVENLFLQWVYQFYIVESFSSHFHNVPLPEWNPAILETVEETLHAMTYIAALIYLYDSSAFKTVVTLSNLEYTEVHVKEKVSALSSTLYAKCAEYGESFRRHGLQGTLPRLWDKIARYAQLSALGRNATYEPKLDSAKDLLGYCIIAWSLVHELEDHG